MASSWFLPQSGKRRVADDPCSAKDQTSDSGVALGVGNAWEAGSNLWKSNRKNTLLTGLADRVRACFIPGKSRVEGCTPLPLPSKRLDWCGFRRKSAQNLEPQGFRGQNLDNKGLAEFFEMAACTASALTMFCSLACGWQGQMSHEERGLCGIRGPRPGRKSPPKQSLDGAPSGNRVQFKVGQPP